MVNLFQYNTDDMTKFIPIKFLDAKSLEFTNGRKFVKSNINTYSDNIYK